MISILFPHRASHPIRQRNLDRVQRHYREVFPDAQVILCDDDDPRDFNRGRALNQGVKQANHDILILADADYIVPPQALLDSVARASQAGFVVPYTEVLYLRQTVTEKFLKRGPWVWKNHDAERHWKQPLVGGVNVITRQNYQLAGGFDPMHRGWGFEDASFSLAVQTLIAPIRWVESVAVHLWHPRAGAQEKQHYHKSLAHCRLYEAAQGDKDKMLELVGPRISELARTLCW